MKYASMITSTEDGGYHVIWINNSKDKEVELKFDKFDNLDEFDEKNVASVFEHSKENQYRVYKIYEYYDENGDLLEPQPIDLIPYKNGLYCHIAPNQLKLLIDFHNTNIDFFNKIKKIIVEKSNNTIELLEIFAEVINKPLRKQIVIQFRTKNIN